MWQQKGDVSFDYHLFPLHSTNRQNASNKIFSQFQICQQLNGLHYGISIHMSLYLVLICTFLQSPLSSFTWSSFFLPLQVSCHKFHYLLFLPLQIYSLAFCDPLHNFNAQIPHRKEHRRYCLESCIFLQVPLLLIFS